VSRRLLAAGLEFWQVSLTPMPSTVSVAGRRVMLMAYNGLYIPRLCGCTGRHDPGPARERARQPTNLHTHGLTVSPRGNSDNVLLNVAPGQTQNYEIRLPANHPSGLFWYHPHPHGFSDEQTRNGMSGALIRRWTAGFLPDTSDILPERLLLLKDLQVQNEHVLLTHIARIPSARSTASSTR